MASKNEIYAAIITRLRSLIQEGETSEAKKVCTQLRSKGIQTPELESLEAWLLLRTLQKTSTNLEEKRSEPSRWLRHFESLWALKREREAVETLLEGLVHHPQEVDFHRRIVSQCAAAGAFDQALVHCCAALAIDSTVPDLLERRAHLAVTIQHPDAGTFIDEMLHTCPDRWLEAHKQYLQLSRPTDAERVLHEAAAHYPEAMNPQIGLAKMALWKGQYALAMEVAPQCINNEQHRSEGYALLGMAQHQAKISEASLSLKEACDLGLPQNSAIERSDLFCFRAMNALERSEWAECIQWCDAAISNSRTGHPFAYLLRIIGSNQGNQRKHIQMNPRWFSHIEDFAPMTGPISDVWKQKYLEFFNVFQDIKTKLHGNLSATSTWIEDGELKGMPLSGLQHHELRFSQQRIRVQTTQDLWHAFETFMAQYPEDPQTYTYSGEVLLWVGRYEEAEALFRKALDGSYITIWTWIGLGAALGYQGRHQEALQAFEDGVRESNFEGPTVFVYRGEFLRKLGHLDQAERDLTIAVQQKPNRLSGWINRVLIDHAKGETTPARILCSAIRRHCTSLWWDAREKTKNDPLTLDGLDTTLEAMLAMMLGNRSSTILTYKREDHPIRGIRWKTENVPSALRKWYQMDE